MTRYQSSIAAAELEHELELAGNAILQPIQGSLLRRDLCGVESVPYGWSETREVNRFNYDDHRLIPPYHDSTLNEVAKIIVQRSIKGVLLIGHTDPIGTPWYNHNLGQQRAASVMFGLKKRVWEAAKKSGYAPDSYVNSIRFVPESRGEECPIPKTAEENRRVEIYLYPTGIPGLSSSLPTLRRGARGPAVQQLQTQLNTWSGTIPGSGARPLVADGVFGQGTETAVRAFQRMVGLVADGTVGPQTWSQLIGATPRLAESEEEAMFGLGRRGVHRPFWRASNFGPDWPGTRVPRGFRLRVGGRTYRVHPNATKHWAEYVRSAGGRGGMAGDFPITPFAGAVAQAQRQGLRPGRNFVTVGSWELGIDTVNNVIYHAVYRP